MFDRRRAGILLHISSLPGGVENGELGHDAFRFVDMLADAGITVWQVLPIGPTHDDGSPYQTLSAHAGNINFICLDAYFENGWLQESDRAVLRDARVNATSRKLSLLEKIKARFEQNADDGEKNRFSDFRRQHAWLKDYAMFVAQRRRFEHRSWTDWPAEFRRRDRSALAEFARSAAGEIELIEFAQFIFFQQWHCVKTYANSKGILLFGDLPIFVAHDSSDVWSYPQYFKLNEHGQPIVVAGVPPDYFSKTGQRWGNPLYDWKALAHDDYQWWIDRLHTQFECFDLVRIDHFRGFEAYWEILAEHDTAINGQWIKGPGANFFKAMQKAFGMQLPLIAEDLGYITPEVHALREQFGMPGMKILQFAFDSGADNPYLPHHHTVDSVVYTGTHDNNTTLGWFNEVSDELKKRIYAYYANPSEAMPWLLIRSAFSSVATLSIIPLQDALSLDGFHRMNTPGTTQGNWRWRFAWQQVEPFSISRLRDLIKLYDR